jgi:glycosyltransferase involved in cell wall biosynthesis
MLIVTEGHILGATMDPSVILAMNSFRLGGSQTYALTLAGILEAAGVEVTIIAKSGPLEAEARHRASRVVTTRWQEGTATDSPPAWKRALYSLNEKRLIAELGRLKPPDAIISSQPFPMRQAARWKEKLWPDTRVAGLIHGTMAVEYPPADLSLINPLIDHWFASTRETHLRLRGEGHQATLLGNIFRGAEYWRERIDPADTFNSLLFCGTLTPNKTAPLFVTLHHLSRNSRLQLTVVGGGPDKSRLEESAKRLGITSRVNFAGPQVDTRQFVAASDCVIGAGRVVIEAASAGRHVVVASSEGVHGPLRSQTFHDASASNFTGRSLSSVPVTEAAMAGALAEACMTPREELVKLQEQTWNVGDATPLLDFVLRSR